MTDKEKLQTAISDAIDETNASMLPERRIEKSMDTLLLGPAAKIDSLGLVSLIIAVEARVEQELGVPITLTDERALAQEKSPFRTIGTLSDYIEGLIEQERVG